MGTSSHKAQFLQIQRAEEEEEPTKGKTKTVEKKCLGLSEKRGRLGNMEISRNEGTSKSSILKEFSLINHPFWGYPHDYGNPHIFVTKMVIFAISEQLIRKFECSCVSQNFHHLFLVGRLPRAKK